MHRVILEATNGKKIPDEVLEDRAKRANLVPANTTALRMGDPLPGYSALERATAIAPREITRDPLEYLMFRRRKTGMTLPRRSSRNPTSEWIEIAIPELRIVLTRRAVEGHDNVAKALRDLIATVTVHPDGDTPRIEVEGRLALLTNADLFPRTVVAGDRITRPRRPDAAVFRFAA